MIDQWVSNKNLLVNTIHSIFAFLFVEVSFVDTHVNLDFLKLNYKRKCHN
jgi:hypothetical protein